MNPLDSYYAPVFMGDHSLEKQKILRVILEKTIVDNHLKNYLSHERNPCTCQPIDGMIHEITCQYPIVEKQYPVVIWVDFLFSEEIKNYLDNIFGPILCKIESSLGELPIVIIESSNEGKIKIIRKLMKKYVFPFGKIKMKKGKFQLRIGVDE